MEKSFDGFLDNARHDRGKLKIASIKYEIMIKIILKKGRGESLRRFHPWVFSGAIAQIQGSPAEGDVVAVHDADGTFLACGHYQVGSIAVRVLSFDADVMSPDFW